MQVWGGQDPLQCLSLSLEEHRMFLHSHVAENPLQVGVPQASLGAGVPGASRRELRVERQSWASHSSMAQTTLSTPLLYFQVSEHLLLSVLNTTPCARSSICTKGQSTMGCDAADSLTHPSLAGEAPQGSVTMHPPIAVIPSLVKSQIMCCYIQPQCKNTVKCWINKSNLVGCFSGEMSLKKLICFMKSRDRQLQIKPKKLLMP